MCTRRSLPISSTWYVLDHDHNQRYFNMEGTTRVRGSRAVRKVGRKKKSRNLSTNGSSKAKTSGDALKTYLKESKELHALVPSEQLQRDFPSCDEASPILSDTVAMENSSGVHRMSSEIHGMQEWEELGIPLPVIRGLYDQGFTHPTPIQKQSIPPAIQDHHDIIGAAETGSGKTLAFAIPILHYILKLHPQLSGTPSHSKSPLNSCSFTTDQTTESLKLANSKKKRKKTRKAKFALKKRKLAKSIREEEEEDSGISDLRNANSRTTLGEKSGNKGVKQERSGAKSSRGAGGKLSKTTQSSKVIDINEVSHVQTIDKTSFEVNKKSSSDEQSDSELEQDDLEDEPEQEQEKLVFEVGSSDSEEGDGSTHLEDQVLSDEEENHPSLMALLRQTQEEKLTQQDQVSSSEEDNSEEENSGEGESLLRQDRNKMSSFRLRMRQRIRAKKKTGFVGFRNHIPEEEFQLMLQGKLDVWDIPSGESSQLVRTKDTKELRVEKSQTSISEQRSEDTPVDEAASPLERSEDQRTPTGVQVPGESKDLSSAEEQRHLPSGDMQVTGIASSTIASQGADRLLALILTPTRELAMQVHSHITAVAKYTGIKVCSVVGGMSTEKQERLLKQRPQIVVATPGRLWKLMSDGDPHLCNLDDLHFLVLDEADRMVEYGHYRELGHILDRVNGVRSSNAQEKQTMVFSATLTITKRTTERKKKKKFTSSQETIDKLMRKVGVREDATVVDLTRSKVTVEMLTETKITCTSEEKDLYLYYFLLLHPGRTIVFVNSIDCLQRVRAIFDLLGQRPLPLHAHMQQRQRLKNLDRFTSSSAAVLVASDVAARGLDLPNVEHIIHYQVPRNTELYVHRSGRTARGHREGLSVMFVGPEDVKSYRNICRTLNQAEDLPNFPVDPSYLRALRGRMSLARQAHTIEYRRDKAKRADKWMTQSAEAAGIDLDDKDLSTPGKWSQNDETKLEQIRGELNHLLQMSLLPHGISRRFPTRDENHTLLAQLQGQSSSGRGMEAIEQEKALSLAKKVVHKSK